MVSRWFLGAVSAAGLAAGFSVSAYAGSAPAAHTTGSSEVERLYHTELALGTREQELQFLLKLRGEQVATAARPAAAVAPVAAAPSRPAAAPAQASVPVSQRIAPTTTTTVAEAPEPPEQEPSPTTSTLPPTTTTTTTVATTTTTTPNSGGGGDDSGGGDH